MNGIHCAFTGRIGKDAEVRTTKVEKPWASFPVAVDSTRDSEAATSWVRVSLFGDSVDELAPRLVNEELVAEALAVEREIRLLSGDKPSIRGWVDACLSRGGLE
jgi:hypothetical protein